MSRLFTSIRFYQYLSLALALVVIGLLVYIFTRPKPIDTLALSQDLNQFSGEIQSWNAQYGANPTPAAKAELSSDLAAFSQKLQTYQ